MNAPATPPDMPRFAIRGQYVKDLSFENPGAPRNLVMPKEAPKIEINIDLKPQKVQDGLYELGMHIVARAVAEGNTLFLVDMVYCGLFAFQNMTKEQIEPVLFADCPFVLFPFARRVVADITRDGGFPPLLLEPVDFHRLYLQKKGLAA